MLQQAMLVCGSTAALMSGSAAAAQPAPAPSQAPFNAPSADNGSPNEIIVTAQKRSERIKDVGLTISAFTGDTLRTAGVVSAADLPKLVPGLTYARSNTGLPVYTLRGVGFYETSLAAYPAVSVYIDQAPLAFPLLTSHTGLDLERVEVLKGPQGILFGQNSTGGAINFIAAKPTSTLHYGGDVTYGRFNRAKVEAFISGPLGPTLRARVAGSVERGDDWQRSYTRNDTLGKIRSYVGRVLLDWRPAETVRFELNLNGWRDKSDPQAAQFFKLSPQLPVTPALTAYPTAPANARAADWGTGADRPRGDQKLEQAALRAEFDIGDATITSLTSYVHARRDDQLDPDGMRLQGYTLLAHGRIKTFFQEVRLANASLNPIRYVVGANYEHSNVLDDGLLTFADSTIPPIYGFATNGLISDQRIRSTALFGNIDAKLASRLTLKVGARYTKTKRSDSGCTYDPGDGNIGAFFTFLSSLLRGSPTPPVGPGGCTSLGPTFLPERFTGQLNEHNLSWRVGLDFKASDNALLYANVTKGYKAGSFPNVAASSNAQFLPVRQESVLAFETGFKVQLADRLLSLDGAAFYYKYADKQLRSKYIDPIFGVLDKLDNIPKSSVRGAEFEAVLTPAPGFRTNLAVTYLKGKIDRFTGVNGAGVLSTFDGTDMPFAPRWSVMAGADYETPLSTTLKGSLGASLSYNSSTYSVVGNDPDSLIKKFTLIDLRAGIGAVNDRWRAGLFVKNLTNAYYWTNAIVVYDQKVRYAGQPRTYGVSLSYRY